MSGAIDPDGIFFIVETRTEPQRASSMLTLQVPVIYLVFPVSKGEISMFRSSKASDQSKSARAEFGVQDLAAGESLHLGNPAVQ